jgi:RING-H2 zinc finger domain
MKRLWINRFDCCTSRKYFKPDVQIGTRCAICTTNFDQGCLYCIAEIDPDEVNRYKSSAEFIWTFLLIEQKRLDSPFNVFDLNIISEIYKRCIEGDYKLNDCTIVKLSCNHAYHKHCFEKWIHKRLSCPLCNGKVIMPTHIENYKKSVIDGSLIKIQSSEYDFNTFYQMEDDAVYIQGVICKELKHYRPGYEYETLYKLVLEKFIRWVDKPCFNNAINALLTRQYIEYDIEDGMYTYVP